MISIFEKSKIDLDLGSLVSIAVADAVASNTGEDFVDYVRNRQNGSGWATTGSTDAATTTLTVSFGQLVSFDRVILVLHNFKNYTIKYYDGATYQNFSTPIAETTNTDDVKVHAFNAVEATGIQIIINGTMSANDDKFLQQLIVTSLIRTFATDLGVKNFQIAKERKRLKTDSGRIKVMRKAGGVSLTLVQDHATDNTDLGIIQDLYDSHEGFLVWLCGGTTTQFTQTTAQAGWRKQDFYLMIPANEFDAGFEEAHLERGRPINVDLVETI